MGSTKVRICGEKDDADGEIRTSRLGDRREHLTVGNFSSYYVLLRTSCNTFLSPLFHTQVLYSASDSELGRPVTVNMVKVN